MNIKKSKTSVKKKQTISSVYYSKYDERFNSEKKTADQERGREP